MPNRPNFPIPTDIHAEPFCLCIQVPNDPVWKQVVAGLLDELNQWYNWQRDEARSGKECAQVWRALYAQIDWSTMSCCCNQIPVQYRYTVDLILQISVDGGETWTNSPESDPRNNSTIFPPMTGVDGEDKMCIAATGMAQLVKEQIGNNLTDDMTRYTLNQVINDWVTTLLQTPNVFEAILTIITNQIFALSIAIIRPALTDAVYDSLQCAFFCNMLEDASFGNTEVSGVLEDIGELIGGVAGLFLQHLVTLLGARGLTNLARSQGATEGDCEDCSCGDDCGTWISEYGTNTYDPETSTYSMLSGDNVGGIYRASIHVSGDELDPTNCCQLVSYSSEYGSLTASYYIDCGVERDIANLEDTWIVGHCVNYLSVQGTTPFQISVTLAPC